MLEHICLPPQTVKFFGVHVGELADLTVGGKADKIQIVASWVALSGLKPLTFFITGKLWLLGKSRELLLLLPLVLSNYFRAKWLIAERNEYMGILLQFQLEQLSVKPLHWRYPLHI